VRLDGTVLVFALGISLLTGILFGLVPALRATATNLQGALREGGRGLVSGAGQRLRSGLVVAEVALAVVLIAGAGLMTRSFMTLLNVDAGFRPERLLAVNFTMNTARHPRPQYLAYYRELIDRVRAVPGVVSAGAIKDAPFRGNGERQGFVPEGMVLGANDQAPTAAFLHVSDGYFATIGARLIAGREYTERDRPGARISVIVNRALADQYFSGRSAVGRTLTVGAGLDAEIIGVVNDIRQTAMEEPARPTVYINNLFNTRIKVTLVARTRGEPLAMARPIQAAIWSVDREQTITSIFTFDDLVNEALARPRLLTVLLGFFGLTGLLLGVVGIYGVLAYLVSNRRRDIGVRMALGAPARAVLGMIVRRGLVLAGIGTVAGLVVAMAMTRYLSDVLFGIRATDAITYGGVVVVMLAAAATASFIPARRATFVDPAVVLRSE
jgi:predicted permease